MQNHADVVWTRGLQKGRSKSPVTSRSRTALDPRLWLMAVFQKPLKIAIFGNVQNSPKPSKTISFWLKITPLATFQFETKKASMFHHVSVQVNHFHHHFHHMFPQPPPQPRQASASAPRWTAPVPPSRHGSPAPAAARKRRRWPSGTTTWRAGAVPPAPSPRAAEGWKGQMWWKVQGSSRIIKDQHVE